ncbi:hypothetical protein [uncultured Microbulbifer sp.]|uniref:hypothetical protein n=1 Tax=uncultured Microbulbifer sp. TaxID=348147 RepID=UPI00260F93A4|nr:hypothetical protein [uncultured Microbulbifer sp.]
MPNIFAQLSLLIWPLIAFLLFKRLSPLVATFWTIVGGYLFLPVKVSFELPLVPSLNKESISAISALMGCVLVGKIRINQLPQSTWAKILLVAGLLFPIATVLTNREPAFNGEFYIPAMPFKEVITLTLNRYILLIPLLLGALLVRNLNDGITVLRHVVLAGVIYSPFIIIEVVLSPQLHTWIYGFFPHSFAQQIRFGGYRPVVFMGHGLLVANFAAIVLVAAVGLWKAKQRVLYFPSIFFVFYLALILVVCKTVGAWILGILGAAILIFTSSKMAVRIVSAMALFIFLYPIMSIFGFVPREWLVETVSGIWPDRALSLAFRFHHEQMMLEHSLEKFMFGWGGWNRNRVFGSVTDGYWIIVLSKYGLASYAVLLGLPLLAVLSGARVLKKVNNRVGQRVAAAYCVIICLMMVDQIPNASQDSWVLFIYGCAIGLFVPLKTAIKKDSVVKSKKPQVFERA